MKTKFKFDKLIRDRAFEMMRDAGVEINLKTELSAEEILSYYKKKIVEEAKEVESADNRENLVEELADCLEVIRGFADIMGLDFEVIERAREKKKKMKGGFENNVIVEDVSLERKGIFVKFYDYYIKNSNKYPIKEKAK